MFCTKCGANVADGAKFCASCGNAVAQPVQQPEYQQPNYQPEYQQPNYQQPNYQQPNYQQASYQANYQQQAGFASYKAPITARNIVTCIILSIVTCGIYGIIWMIDLVDDLNTASQSTGEPSGGTVFLLSLITCGIYSFVWMYKAGEKVDRIKQLSGQPAGSSTGIVYLVLCLFGLGLVSYCLIQSELNKVAVNA